jgi:hypothetical protein
MQMQVPTRGTYSGRCATVTYHWASVKSLG